MFLYSACHVYPLGWQMVLRDRKIQAQSSFSAGLVRLQARVRVIVSPFLYWAPCATQGDICQSVLYLAYNALCSFKSPPCGPTSCGVSADGPWQSLTAVTNCCASERPPAKVVSGRRFLLRWTVLGGKMKRRPAVVLLRVN